MIGIKQPPLDCSNINATIQVATEMLLVSSQSNCETIYTVDSVNQADLFGERQAARTGQSGVRRI